MRQLFKNQFVYIPLYLIKECDNCYFFDEKHIYNINTKKVSKLKVKGTSVGFNLKGKFVLEKNIEKIKVTKLSKNL